MAMIDKDRNNEAFQVIIDHKNKSIKLFGIDVNLGDEVTVLPQMRLLDRDLLAKKAELFSEGDTLRIEMRAVDDKKVVSIYKKYSDLDEREFIRCENIFVVNQN